MHYNIFYNGCSLTFGLEIAGNNTEDRLSDHKYYEYRLNNRFSQIVTNATNLTHCNISYPGVSNDNILETTVNWFETGNTCDLAIIQWSSPLRFVYYNNKGERLDSKSKDFIISDEWMGYSKFRTPENDQYRFDMIQYWMNYYLKGKCEVIYLYPKVYDFNKKYYETALYCKHSKLDDPHYILTGPKSILNDPHRGRHPDAEGHRKIADYLLNIIKSRGYCNV